VAGAQGVRFSGQVVRHAGSGTEPVAGQWAVLHRVGPGGMGALDSVRTDRTGTFRFTVSRPDTTAQYVVGVRHAGVGYLSEAMKPGAPQTLAIFDTSSTEYVMQGQRHVLIQPPNPDGSIPVLELIVLRNPGTRARVASDTTRPSWTGHLLRGATDAEIGESDVRHDAILHGGDSIAVLAPITPGEKQIVLTYLLPRGLAELTLPVDDSIGILGIMIADTLATVAPGRVTALGVTSFENVPYLRLEASDVSPGPPLTIRLSRRPRSAADFWWVVVALAAAGMAGAFTLWSRAHRARAGLSDAEVLALQVAALDAALATGENADWRARRGELATRLRGTLANQERLP
jgi:hypothetical protein